MTDDPEFSSYYISKNYRNMQHQWKDDETLMQKYVDAKLKFVKHSKSHSSSVIEPIIAADGTATRDSK